MKEVKAMEKIRELLPARIYRAAVAVDGEDNLEEIRIRLGRQAYVVASGRSIIINVIATQSEMSQILTAASHGSLYAYRDCIIKGYIPLADGIRVGVVGRAGVEMSKITGIYDINEISVRIPHPVRVECDELLSLARAGSLLVYSPPGEGKTTLLRELSRRLASGRAARRVAVIDTREELAWGLEGSELLVTVLSGYPRREGIEIAVRTMNTQHLVCDEIGNIEDSSAIIEAQGAGVPLLASCHASSVRDMLSHRGMRELHKHKIFDHYVGIKRAAVGGFTYEVSDVKEIDDRW